MSDQWDFSGGGAGDHGRLKGLTDDDHVQYLLIDGTRAMTGLLNCDLGATIDGALTDIGAGTYALVDGDNDLGVAGDFEVDGDVRFDGEIGLRTASQSTALIYCDYSGTDIVRGIDIALESQFNGGVLPNGVNILLFDLWDDAGAAGSSNTFRAARMRCGYDRSTVNNSTIRCLELNYGIRQPMSGTNVLSSGTHVWRGLLIDAQDATAGDVTGGIVTLIDLECGNAPTGFGAATLTHYAAKFNDVVWFTAYVGIGVNQPATPLELAEIFAHAGPSLTDGYAAALTCDPGYSGAVTVTRHNYIELDNPSVVFGAAVTNACIFRFDAAAGTHKAVDGATTKTTPGTVNAWPKININGTIFYIPAYTSKTS